MTAPNPPQEQEVPPEEQKKRALSGFHHVHLTLNAYHQWARDKWVMYAAVTTRGKYLLMEANLLGMYRVTIGSNVDVPRYLGPSLEDALNTYNEEL